MIPEGLNYEKQSHVWETETGLPPNFPPEGINESKLYLLTADGVDEIIKGSELIRRISNGEFKGTNGIGWVNIKGPIKNIRQTGLDLN